MGHGSYAVRGKHAKADSVAGEGACRQFVSGEARRTYIEEHDVGLDPVQVQRYARRRLSSEEDAAARAWWQEVIGALAR